MLLPFLDDSKSLLSNRLSWVDYAKGIAIILVVYRHVLSGFSRNDLAFDATLLAFNEALYLFRMPFFFLLAGLFLRRALKKRLFGGFLRNKVAVLLYPYLLWAFIHVSLQLLFDDYLVTDRGLIDYFYILVQPRKIDHFWFLYALFNVSVIYAWLDQTWRVPLWAQLGLGLALHGLSVPVNELSLLRDFCYFYVFFGIGVAMADTLHAKETQQWMASWKATVFILPVFALAQWYWFYAQIPLNGYLVMLITLLGCAFLAHIAFVLAQMRRLKLLCWIGAHSRYIYILHILVIYATRLVIVDLLGMNAMGWVFGICLVAAIVLPIGIYRLSEKMGLRGLFSFDPPNVGRVPLVSTGFVRHTQPVKLYGPRIGRYSPPEMPKQLGT